MLTIELKGLEEVQAQLKMLQEMGNNIQSVDLNSKDRQENSDKNNAEILDYLIKGGREFTTQDINDDNKLISAVADKMKETILSELTKYPDAKKEPARIAKQIIAKALIAAMELAKEIISDRIDKGVDKNGTKVRDLSPSYATYKEKTYGNKYPIGVATGQLLDNLAPGTRNIKLNKSKNK